MFSFVRFIQTHNRLFIFKNFNLRVIFIYLRGIFNIAVFKFYIITIIYQQVGIQSFVFIQGFFAYLNFLFNTINFIYLIIIILITNPSLIPIIHITTPIHKNYYFFI